LLTELKRSLGINFKIYVNIVRVQPLSLLGTIIVLSFVLIGLLAPILAPSESADPYISPYDGPPSSVIIPDPTLPSPEHPFGTLLGYDLFHGCIWGIRTAFYVSIVTTTAAVVIGISIGSIAGYFEGVVDEVLMRFTDAFFALPGIIYVLLVVTVIPLTLELNLGLINFSVTLSSIDRIILALTVIGWPSYARLVRSETKRVRQLEFVEAAKAIGCSPLRVMTKHVLPNSRTSVLALAFLNIGGVLLAAATVSFLGFGPGRGYAEWGSIIASSRSYLVFATEATLQVALLPLIPASFLSVFVLGWSLLGDAIMYVEDPTIRREVYL